MSSVDLLTDNPQSLATSWGYFSRLGFADDDKNTGKLVPCSVANVFGWMATFPNTSPAPANLGVNHPGVVDISAEPDRGKNPDLITFRIRQSPVKGTYSELYLEWRGDNVLKPGERSAIYGFTSDYPPTFKDVNVGGGGNPPNPIWIQ